MHLSQTSCDITDNTTSLQTLCDSASYDQKFDDRAFSHASYNGAPTLLSVGGLDAKLFPRDIPELTAMVSVALKYIWANRYFPDEFISNRELALPSLPDRGEKLFDDASKRVVAERPQEGRILCCAYLTCANQLHRLAFDQSFGKEKLDLLEGVRLSYLQHVGECGDVEFYRYWEELVVSVGSEIRELAMHRRITATAYYTFKDLIEAISSQNEFSSIAENQLYMFCSACLYDPHYSVGRPLFRHWLTRMGGLLDVGRCLEILKDERELCRRFRLLIVVFTALKSMDLIQREVTMPFARTGDSALLNELRIKATNTAQSFEDDVLFLCNSMKAKNVYLQHVWDWIGHAHRQWFSSGFPSRIT